MRAPTHPDPGLDLEDIQAVAGSLVEYRATYEERFGPVDLNGRVVRIRAEAIPDSDGLAHRGMTYSDTIDLQSDNFNAFPHELHHLEVGRGHSGWCVDFEPWEEQTLGVEERAYLGC